jgi:hypothetical protein
MDNFTFTMETYGSTDLLFSFSELEEDEWSASSSYCFTPGKTVLDEYSIEGWVSPIAGLDAIGKGKDVPVFN